MDTKAQATKLKFVLEDSDDEEKTTIIMSVDGTEYNRYTTFSDTILNALIAPLMKEWLLEKFPERVAFRVKEHKRVEWYKPGFTKDWEIDNMNYYDTIDDAHEMGIEITEVNHFPEDDGFDFMVTLSWK